MCDVHFVPTSRSTGTCSGTLLCSLCGGRIDGGVVVLEGQLDDGSTTDYKFVYHADCEEGMYDDLDTIDANDGCFTFGTPARASP